MNTQTATQESRGESPDLAKRLQRQDRAAWDELVALEHRRLFNLHLRLCGDREQAADLTQETFKCAYQSSHTFSGRCQPQTWLYSVALNVNRNWWRQQGRHEPPEELRDDLADPEPSAEQLAILHEQGHLVNEAVSRLPEAYRRAIALRYFAGITAMEIAAAEGISAGTIRWRLHEALKRLWETLEPQLKGDLS
ncbi:MAG: RNA polymerase sigma factor [Armatimonadota bacterium]